MHAFSRHSRSPGADISHMRSAAQGHTSASKLFLMYAAATLVPVLAVGVLLAISYRQHVERGGVAEARSQAALLSDDVIRPVLGREPLNGSVPAAVDSLLDAAFARATADQRLARMRLRDATGLVIWSDDGSGLGTSGGDDEVDEALEGDAVGKLTRLNVDAGDTGPAGPRVVEVYYPIKSQPDDEKPIGVLEMYVPYAPIEADVASGLRRTYLVLGVGLAFLWLVLALISASTTKRLRRQSDRLAYLAHYDDASGLLNRVGFADKVAHRLAITPEQPPAVALVNVSRFRDVNDALGRDSGDEILFQLGRRLVAAAGDNAIVGRMGGDEFGIACFAHNRCDIEGWATRLQAAASEPIEAAGVPVLVEVAVGFHRAEPNQSVDTVLTRADVALVHAKSTVDRRARYSPSFERSDASSLALLARLRDSLGNGGLELHYQPKTSLRDGGVESVEALVRWRLDDTLLSPGVFLPLAEQTALVHPLTDWVAREALRQLASWGEAAAGVGMAINVSARNVSDPAFADRLLRIVADSAVDPRLLTVEITETALLADPDAARKSLSGIHEAGMSISIDDFGQGQTSLAYLASLPVDELKIDRAFVAQVCDDSTQDAIVRSVIQLGHSLGLRVVAEGIEDERTLDRLIDLEADVGQGFYIARPMRPDRFADWREDHDRARLRVVG